MTDSGRYLSLFGEGEIVSMILKSVPEHLLDGLPDEDQVAIRAAIGKPVTLVGHDEDGRAILEFSDETGDMHTIWVDPASLEPIDSAL
jgi:hypothetical protein